MTLTLLLLSIETHTEHATQSHGINFSDPYMYIIMYMRKL